MTHNHSLSFLLLISDYKVPRLDTIAPSPQISPGKDVKPVHEANTSTPSLNTSEGTPLLSNSKMKQQKQKKKSKSTKKKIQRKITLMAQRTCCHSFFILISTYSCISIIFLMISQSLPLMLIPIETLQILLRVYILFFCLFLLIAESNKNWFGIQQTFISQNWMMKGIFHSFLGLIAVEQSVAMDVHDTDSAMNRKDHMGWIEGFGNHNVVTALEIFINTSSWMMVASGAVYFL